LEAKASEMDMQGRQSLPPPSSLKRVMQA